MAKYNVSKKEAKKHGIERVKISGSSSSSSKDEKKAKKKIKKFYEEKEKREKEEAARKQNRLAEDLANIFKDAGIAQTRATQDYITNIGNINSGKSSESDDLNFYLQTARERGTEDLDLALAKESRRYSLEYDRINEDLADRGLTFSERKDETVAKEGSELNTEELKLVSSRSFQDLQRFEYEKNRDIQTKYDTLTKQAETEKKRNLEDIDSAKNDAVLNVNRGQEDITFGLKNSLTDIDYAKDTDVATLEQQFDIFDQTKQLNQERRDVIGY